MLGSLNDSATECGSLLCLERHSWNLVKVGSEREGRQGVGVEALKDYRVPEGGGGQIWGLLCRDHHQG